MSSVETTPRAVTAAGDPRDAAPMGERRRGLLGRLWRPLRRDIGRKLLALTLAVTTWSLLSLYVSDQRALELDVRVVASKAEADVQRNLAPAVYLVVAEDFIVRDDLSRRRVRVDVSGFKDDLAGLEMSAVLEVPLDALGDADEVELPLLLDDRAIFSSKGGEPDLADFSVHPGTLRLTLARAADAEFTLSSVNVSVRGTPREGYAFDESRIRVHPNRVKISGPHSAIDYILADPSRLKLSPVDIEGRMWEVSQQVGLDPERVDRSVTLDTLGGRVEVAIPIQPVDIGRELLSVPVTYANPEALVLSRRRLVSATESVDLEVFGPRSVLDTLSNEQLLQRIFLRFDWADASLPRASERVVVFTQGLPATIRIQDLQGRHPEIEYELEDLGTAPPLEPETP